jgi:hypothetical protein
LYGSTTVYSPRSNPAKRRTSTGWTAPIGGHQHRAGQSIKPAALEAERDARENSAGVDVKPGIIGANQPHSTSGFRTSAIRPRSATTRVTMPPRHSLPSRHQEYRSVRE